MWRQIRGMGLSYHYRSVLQGSGGTRVLIPPPPTTTTTTHTHTHSQHALQPRGWTALLPLVQILPAGAGIQSGPGHHGMYKVARDIMVCTKWPGTSWYVQSGPGTSWYVQSGPGTSWYVQSGLGHHGMYKVAWDIMVCTKWPGTSWYVQSGPGHHGMYKVARDIMVCIKWPGMCNVFSDPQCTFKSGMQPICMLW